MKETLFERAGRLFGQFFLQTVPPALLAAYCAGEVARATGASFGEAITLVTAGVAACIAFGALRE